MRCAAADDDAFGAKVVALQRFDDVAQPIRDAFHQRAKEVAAARLQGEPPHRAAGKCIRVRRAVALKIVQRNQIRRSREGWRPPRGPASWYDVSPAAAASRLHVLGEVAPKPRQDGASRHLTRFHQVQPGDAAASGKLPKTPGTWNSCADRADSTLDEPVISPISPGFGHALAQQSNEGVAAAGGNGNTRLADASASAASAVRPPTISPTAIYPAGTCLRRPAVRRHA